MTLEGNGEQGESIFKLIPKEVLERLSGIATDRLPLDHPFHEDLSANDENIQRMIKERKEQDSQSS